MAKKKTTPANKSAKKKPVSRKKKASKSAAKSKAKKTVKKKVVKKKAKAAPKKVTKKKVAKKVAKKASKKAAATAVEEVAPKKKSSGRLVQTNNGAKGKRKKITSVLALKGYDKHARSGADGSNELTTAQLRKIDSGLTRAEINYYKKVLLAKRAEILGDVQLLEKDALTENGEGISYEHMADAGSDNFEQEFNLELMEADRRMLELINNALGRIADGTYGVCVETGVAIGKERLDAKPWAKWSILVARDKERLGQL